MRMQIEAVITPLSYRATILSEQDKKRGTEVPPAELERRIKIRSTVVLDTLGVLDEATVRIHDVTVHIGGDVC